MDICRLTYLAAVAQTPPTPNADRFLDYAWSLCQVLLRHQAPGGGLFDGSNFYTSVCASLSGLLPLAALRRIPDA